MSGHHIGSITKRQVRCVETSVAHQPTLHTNTEQRLSPLHCHTGLKSRLSVGHNMSNLLYDLLCSQDEEYDSPLCSVKMCIVWYTGRYKTLQGNMQFGI